MLNINCSPDWVKSLQRVSRGTRIEAALGDWKHLEMLEMEMHVSNLKFDLLPPAAAEL